MISITPKSAKACVPVCRRSRPSISRRILRKSAFRSPLALKNLNVTIAVRLPKATASRLPRALGKPQPALVSRAALDAAHPELAGVPTEYIRKGLALTGADMLAAVQNTHVQAPTSALPRALAIDAAAAHAPTHMLAVYAHPATATSTAPSTTKVTLYPAHDLVFAAHCAHLPAFPSSPAAAASTGTSTSTKTVPVVPLALPAPGAFPALQAYLYTQRADRLFAAFLPSLPASTSASMEVPTLAAHLASTAVRGDLRQRAALVHGVWANACALGVQDDRLWGAVGFAWQALVGALDALDAQC